MNLDQKCLKTVMIVRMQYLYDKVAVAVAVDVAVDVAVAVVAVVVVAVVAVDENDLDVAVVGNAIAHVIHLESALPWTAVQWGDVATLVAVVLVVVD